MAVLSDFRCSFATILLDDTLEETGDLAVDASASELKAALEDLPSIGIVDVTREDLGSNAYSWLVTFTEPAIAPSVMTADDVDSGDNDDSDVSTTTPLAFPLLYAGGREWRGKLDLNTLGSDATINTTRVRRGNLGPLAGQVRPAYPLIRYDAGSCKISFAQALYVAVSYSFLPRTSSAMYRTA